jgi:hypothetical protein
MIYCLLNYYARKSTRFIVYRITMPEKAHDLSQYRSTFHFVLYYYTSMVLIQPTCFNVVQRRLNWFHYKYRVKQYLSTSKKILICHDDKRQWNNCAQNTCVLYGGSNCITVESVHNICVQFRCSYHLMLHWNPMVISTKRFERRNCSYHRQADNVVESADSLAILSCIQILWCLGKNCMAVIVNFLQQADRFDRVTTLD